MSKRIGTAMVVGAGISGIRSALDLAEYGYQVTLVDKESHIGGILSQLDYQFPNDGCGMCRMLPLVDRDASSQYCLRRGLFHDNITIELGAALTAVEGEPGSFKITLEQKPSSVDPDLCIGCGKCAEVCPVEVADAFNMGLSMHKAIYLPVPHNIPNNYVIDLARCNRCGECVKACPTGAVKLPEERRKNFRILVVDDELIVRDSLKEWLEFEGFCVDMADSGRAALDQLSQKRYHLMLTDIKMPGMDGVEVLTKAKEAFPDLPVVMMTAYATVETAIEAMKTGALDYLLKPFDPQNFTPKILEIYQSLDVVEKRDIEVNALVISTGTGYFNPLESKNTFGYGTYPDVVTSREFERLLSGTGPGSGKLFRQSDQMPVKKIAWLQCVGSRDLQNHADFCSSVCCMHAIKEARLVKNKAGDDIETTIFYMDMRAFGKAYYQYKDQAATDLGIRFERSRVHSVIENTDIGGLRVDYMDQKGERHRDQFDIVVLSIGQRPSPAADELAGMMDLTLNEWGFCKPERFSTSLSGQDGIYLGGSFTGLKDISESVIQSSAAALSASRFIHSKGGGLAPKPDAATRLRDVTREAARLLVIVCTCDGKNLEADCETRLKQDLMDDPVVFDVIFCKRSCTVQGWSDLASTLGGTRANRILIGACLPYAYKQKIVELSNQTGIPPELMDIEDISSFKWGSTKAMDHQDSMDGMAQRLKMGISRLKRMDPPVVRTLPSVQKALVLGGGIAGLTAALSIADHGFKVDLIEKETALGGNLQWLEKTIDDDEIRPFLEETVDRIDNHPLVTVHTSSVVTSSFGGAGRFLTTIHHEKEDAPNTIEHGVTILATGGSEARTSSYGHGSSHQVVTQKELETGLTDGTLDPAKLKSVVMIQCVDSRQKSKKNYCSRI